ELRLRVPGREPQSVIGRRLDVCVGVEIDRCIENASAVEVAERREIGAASRETKAQGGASANDQWGGPLSGLSRVHYSTTRKACPTPLCGERLGRRRFGPT